MTTKEFYIKLWEEERYERKLDRVFYNTLFERAADKAAWIMGKMDEYGKKIYTQRLLIKLLAVYSLGVSVLAILVLLKRMP